MDLALSCLGNDKEVVCCCIQVECGWSIAVDLWQALAKAPLTADVKVAIRARDSYDENPYYACLHLKRRRRGIDIDLCRSWFRSKLWLSGGVPRILARVNLSAR